ncbi:MAG TPA: caspase family protein, partial [Terracidiphilus sp.]|nr:caspase family protein [Terracidiphilus sp.]
MPSLLRAGVLFFFATAALVPAQQANSPAAPPAMRGIQPENSEEPAVRNGHLYVVAIGIDHYKNWLNLSTAVSDATGFAELLTKNFGFEEVVPPLTDQNATRDAINKLVSDDLRPHLHPEDSLIFFFAGHGTTQPVPIENETRNVGYIVPWDAPAQGGDEEHWSDYVRIDSLLQGISELPPNHILVILDSCYSGMALGDKVSAARGDVQLQQDIAAKASRQVISSADRNQTAADRGPVPGHSLFTGLMIQGLTSRKADMFHRGWVSASLLGLYVKDQIGEDKQSHQVPQFGTFDGDDGGELIIPMGKESGADAAQKSDPESTLSEDEKSELDRVHKEEHYWRADDPLKRFALARSGAVKLCEGGDAWGCEAAARSFTLGLGGGSDYARAVEMAQEACQAQRSGACVLLGTLYQQGETIEPDLQSAQRLFEESCDQGNLRGCIGLSRMYMTGQGVAKDPEKAKDLFAKACAGGEMQGCNGLGALYAYAVGVPQNYAEALSDWQKACGGGFMRSCENLGNLYLFGEGVSKDTAQAIKYYRKGCDGGGMESCSNLGWMLENGNGTAKDLEQSAKLYKQACEG